MHLHMHALSGSHQVLKPVIGADAIDVMNHVVWGERDAVGLFVDQPVFKYVTSLPMWMARRIRQHVPLIIKVPVSAIVGMVRAMTTDCGRMPTPKAVREALVDPALGQGPLRNRCGQTTAALTEARGGWPVGGWFHPLQGATHPRLFSGLRQSQEMTQDVAGRISPMRRARRNHLSASTLTDERQVVHLQSIASGLAPCQAEGV